MQRRSHAVGIEASVSGRKVSLNRQGMHGIPGEGPSREATACHRLPEAWIGEAAGPRA